MVPTCRSDALAGLASGLMLLGAAGAILPAKAGSPSAPGDGSAVTNQDLLRPSYEWQPAPSGPLEPETPFYDIDWSLGLRGAYITDQSGSRYQALVLPNITLTHTGKRVSFNAGASAQISRLSSGQSTINSLRLSAGSDFAFGDDASLATNASFAVTQEDANNPDVATDVATTPVKISGAADAAFTRKLGRLSAIFRGNAERDVYGPTTLADTTKIDNTSQNLSQLGGGLRLGFELTPILTVFADGSATRQVFDAPIPSLGVKLDATNYAFLGGVSAKWNDVLQAEISAGVGLDRFDDQSLGDVRATLYNASLTFKPNETLTLTGDFSTTISPPGPDNAGTARVDYAATGSASYLVNQWLDLRASAGWHDASLADTSNTETGYDLGVGADYTLSKHAKLTADYGFGHSTVTPNPAVDTHTVTLGLTFSK